TVAPVARAARSRGVPVVAFSTDANAAARGVYLLSFLPESDVDRIVSYAASQGRRSFAALVPGNAYGSVTEAACQQAGGRGGGAEWRTGYRARALPARPRADASSGAQRRAGG